MAHTLTKLWVDDQRLRHDLLEIRADFSNDRHYAFRVARPFTRAGLVLALREMAAYIESDPALDEPPNADITGCRRQSGA